MIDYEAESAKLVAVESSIEAIPPFQSIIRSPISAAAAATTFCFVATSESILSSLDAPFLGGSRFHLFSQISREEARTFFDEEMSSFTSYLHAVIQS